jgi:hypothetical protein
LRENINAFKLGFPDGTEAIESAAKGYKFLLEYMRTSTIEMIEAAEALDIFLSKFTREI